MSSNPSNMFAQPSALLAVAVVLGLYIGLFEMFFEHAPSGFWPAL